ncbi:MAG: dihydrofolate reductase family protein [Nocardioides sp.]
MTEWRVLLAPDGLDRPEGVDRPSLAALYAPPPGPWWRANMVSTIDGVAAGADGRSGAINDETDREVFALLRAQADAVVVGAGTARTEGYRPADRPLFVVSNSGRLPATLTGADPGSVTLVLPGAARRVPQARETLGAERVWVVGERSVDLRALRDRMAESGLVSVVCEGGPSLLRVALASGVVDELCLTWVPRLLAGDATRLLTGSEIDVTLMLQMLLMKNSTLLGRWHVR